jgi:very-short-patch-repair endonuclease
MSAKGATVPVAESILDFARGQHGVVAGDQLRALGVTRHAIQSRVAAGWLTRLHRGVFAVAGRDLSWRGRWMAAVLACGQGALLSHRCAADLWRLTKPAPGEIDVTVPGQGGRRPHTGIKLHRSITLTEPDFSERDSIPVTSPSRTITDLARAGVSGRPLERLLDEADRLNLLDPSAFNAASRSRPLPKSLRELLTSHQAGSTLTRSDLEELFLGLVRQHDLPQPLVNAELLGLTVDFLWPAAALAVEVDGRGSHDTRRGFQDDRDRDSMLVAAGFRTMRFTHWDLIRRPAIVADRLRRALG